MDEAEKLFETLFQEPKKTEENKSKKFIEEIKRLNEKLQKKYEN